MADPVVTTRDLTHHFGEQPHDKQVLFDITLDVAPGELVIMTGPSGSGKTTLLTLLGGLRATQAGSNRVLGQELLGLAPRDLVDLRRRIGFIFQLHNLFDSLSAGENVKMALELHDHSASERNRLAREALAQLGLGDRVASKPRELSGGQRQRVAIARALVNRPKLILADEPTAALDKDASRDVVDLLRRLTREENATILMVTHDSRILDVADRIVNMVDGQIESDVHVEGSIYVCELLKRSKVFEKLSPTELLNVAEQMTREQHSAGTRIIEQGDEGETFHVIGSGKVEVHVSGKHVAELGEAEFFGEQSLLTDEPRNATIVAAEDVVIYSLEKAAFRKALAMSDDFDEQLRKVAFQR
ncbi:MAG: ATP-binding cassette domain-containing protein [Acidobacteriota bacterium]